MIKCNSAVPPSNLAKGSRSSRLSSTVAVAIPRRSRTVSNSSIDTGGLREIDRRREAFAKLAHPSSQQIDTIIDAEFE